MYIVPARTLQTFQFAIKHNDMSTNPIELSSFRLSRSIANRDNQNEIREKSVTDFDDDYELLRNREIGTRNPETSFERFLGLNVKIMKWLGLFSMNFRLSGRLVNTTRSSILPVLVLGGQIMFLMACEVRAFVRFWSTDTDFAVSAITAFVSGVLLSFKAFRAWMCQVELRELLIHLAILWEKSRFQENVQRKTLNMAERSRYIQSWYIAFMSIVTITYVTRPYLLLLQFQLRNEANETYDYTVTGTETYYPFVIDTFVKYLACVMWEIFIGIVMILYWLAANAFFAQLVTHTVIQFQVLHCDLKCIGEESEITNAKDEEILLRKLSSIVKRHSQLFAHCQKIEAIYNSTIFLTMMSTAVSMCFCALNVQKDMSNGNHKEIYIVQNIGHFIMFFVELVIYCGCADSLTEQSFEIAQAAYHCHWIERSNRFKINVQIIMMRAQKYYCLSGYGFFHLTLAQITTILKATMSYFTLLKTLT